MGTSVCPVRDQLHHACGCVTDVPDPRARVEPVRWPHVGHARGTGQCPDGNRPLPDADDSSQAEIAAISPGTRLGPYVVEREIGSGAMGVVFAAIHSHSQQRVALKILPRQFSDDPIATSRFRKEARLAGSLGHPNIVAVLDVGTLQDGSPYMAMEYLSGWTLSSYIKHYRALALNQAVDILGRLLYALTATHSRGILHRDLKSENVMLVTSPEGWLVPKILDFGVSKSLQQPGEGNSNTVMTRTGIVLGTPSYMSPEQAEGRALDARADLYSAGVIAYEMLVGDLPYKSRHPTYLLLEMRARVVPKLRSVRADVSEGLENVVARLMALNRDFRFASADEALAALTTLR